MHKDYDVNNSRLLDALLIGPFKCEVIFSSSTTLRSNSTRELTSHRIVWDVPCSGSSHAQSLPLGECDCVVEGIGLLADRIMSQSMLLAVSEHGCKSGTASGMSSSLFECCDTPYNQLTSQLVDMFGFGGAFPAS